MDRNVKKSAEKGEKLLSYRRGISGIELRDLMSIAGYPQNITSGNVLDVIGTSFYFGVLAGYKQAQADIKKSGNTQKV